MPVRATNDAVDVAAQAINAADLDVLVNANGKLDACDLLDRIETPCVLNICPGSDFLHHERVAIQMNGQPQADYFFVDRRMFCATTGDFVGHERLYPMRGHYDLRDIALGGHKGWAERRPLIAFHGSLYKLAHQEVLTTIFALLADDSTVEFVFMGKDSLDALARIGRTAGNLGVEERVHYAGTFDATRSATGTVLDPGWTRLKSYLADARLAPDPWPVGGASARFEAFSMGVPSVHMGVRQDPASWGRPQPGMIEVPHMATSRGVAWSVEEYGAISDRCLHDAAFADALSAEQFRIARQLSDPARLWQQVFDCYREWLESVGRTTAHVDPVLRTISDQMAEEPTAL